MEAPPLFVGVLDLEVIFNLNFSINGRETRENYFKCACVMYVNKARDSVINRESVRLCYQFLCFANRFVIPAVFLNRVPDAALYTRDG